MAGKSLNYYLVKTARVSGWLLFLLVLLYIVTGFALCGEFGFGHIIDEQLALTVHKVFEWPLVVTFVTHSAITIYFAFRRWGWINPRAKSLPSTKPTSAISSRNESREPHAANS
jgi:hypothetical protein